MLIENLLTHLADANEGPDEAELEVNGMVLPNRFDQVELDDSMDSIIVFDYDYDSAIREGVDEDELHEDHEYAEHTSLEEVLRWIKNWSVECCCLVHNTQHSRYTIMCWRN